jgi:hypothetical protein
MLRKIIAGIICIGVAAWVAVLVATPHGGIPAMATSSESQAEKDKTLVEAAAQLNDQWKSTFDKTGKFPEKQDPGWHKLIYGKLLYVTQDSPSYTAARKLIDEGFGPRQVKIDRIALKSAPPDPQDPTIDLKSLDRSYNQLQGTIILKNPNIFPIADVKITCLIYADSGTAIRDVDFTLYQVVPAKGHKTISGYKFGFWPDQGKRVGCSTAGYQRR